MLLRPKLLLTMIAFITGSGFYDLPGFASQRTPTRFGEAQYLQGAIAGTPLLLLPRHGAGHAHLPHQINHRANLVALKKAGATAVVSLSVCGALEPTIKLGAPLLATDVYYPDNRLGNGTTCTIFNEPGESGRGHLLAGNLLHTALSRALNKLILELTEAPAQAGVYGQVNGPRFNTKAEIAALRHAGVSFISQTCGPEAVLANELELPYAMVGFAVDYANGVMTTPTPVDTLQANLGASKKFFERLVREMTEPAGGFSFENFVYRFD